MNVLTAINTIWTLALFAVTTALTLAERRRAARDTKHLTDLVTLTTELAALRNQLAAGTADREKVDA